MKMVARIFKMFYPEEEFKKSEEMEYTDKDISDFRRMKIGLLVRNTLPKILEQSQITELEIKKLQEPDYSKFTFDVNFPILKKVNEKRSITENRTENSYTRYYANPVKNNGARYLITSEWYEQSLDNYIKWLQRKVIS